MNFEFTKNTEYLREAVSNSEHLLKGYSDEDETIPPVSRGVYDTAIRFALDFTDSVADEDWIELPIPFFEWTMWKSDEKNAPMTLTWRIGNVSMIALFRNENECAVTIFDKNLTAIFDIGEHSKNMPDVKTVRNFLRAFLESFG